MSWVDLQEVILKSWIGIFTVFLYPIGRWINNKRKNYELLEKRVEELERQGKQNHKDINGLKDDVTNIETKIDTNQEILCSKLDLVADRLYEVSKDTAVNSAKIEANKEK